MKKIKYLDDCVKPSDMPIIVQALPILKEFADAGYRVTLRQLHYQFVSRNIMPNTKQTYRKICVAMRNGRLGGIIGWDIIEDRTRNLRSLSRWRNPAGIVDACAEQYHTDFWKNQKYRAEIWIEKDALLGIIEETCNRWDVPHFSCRGYDSISELHESALRIKRYNDVGQVVKILYAGDHDPSGLNMGTTIKRTLKEFDAGFEFERIALNGEQIKRLNPPSIPVKERDPRSKKYRGQYGDECWELDTLPPQVLNEIIENAIISCIDDTSDFDERRQEDIEGREQLRVLGDNFDVAVRLLKEHLWETNI